MNTELETNPVKETPIISTTKTGALLPGNFAGLWRMAQIMAASGFMPKGMERVESVFVAVQFGMEVGLSPMQAVQNIAPINGRPAIWGDAMLGLVRASGLLDAIKEEFVGESDQTTAVCSAWRRGEDNPIIGRFSVQDAKRAQLWGKPGPWQQYPRRMLQMRARGFCLRDGFPDVLKGLYAREELEGQSEQYMGQVVEAGTDVGQSATEKLLAEARRREAQSEAKESTDPPEALEQEDVQAEQQQSAPDGAEPSGPRPEPNALGIVVDTNGVPWIPSVHSANRTWNDDGTWRRKRGVDPDLLRRLEDQAKANVAGRLAELDEKKEIAPWETDQPPAETDPRDPPPTESGGAGFSYAALLEEARFADTDVLRDEVRDLMRTSNFTDAERETIENILRR